MLPFLMVAMSIGPFKWIKICTDFTSVMLICIAIYVIYLWNLKESGSEADLFII